MKNFIKEQKTLFLIKSSHWMCSIKQAVLKNFTIFTGKHLCWSLFLIKLQAWGPEKACNFVKKTPAQGFFLWILQNFHEHLFWKTSVNGCFSLFHIYQCIFTLKGDISKLPCEMSIWQYAHTSVFLQTSKTCSPQNYDVFRYIATTFLYSYFLPWSHVNIIQHLYQVLKPKSFLVSSFRDIAIKLLSQRYI